MDRESHNIEIVAGDTSDEAATSALNTIATSLVHGFSRINIALQCDAMFIFKKLKSKKKFYCNNLKSTL